MITKLSHKDNQGVSFHRMNYKQTKIGIAEYIMYKAVMQKESLNLASPSTVVENKMNLIKNFFSDSILQEYEMENLEENDENDLSYAIRGFRKRVKINDIIFLNDENKNIKDDIMYKLSLFDDTNKAVVFFTVCNDLLETCQKYQTFIEFEIGIPVNFKNKKQEDRVIKFKITSYQKQAI